jgi:hypothetical protein
MTTTPEPLPEPVAPEEDPPPETPDEEPEPTRELPALSGADDRAVASLAGWPD